MASTQTKPTILLENGTTVPCHEPIIISASRSTDIPAFYCDWFFHRLRVGYSAWTNPFNGVKMYISYAKTRFIVFWSKNPRPLLGYLDELKDKGIACYIQYSLNDYEEEKLEKGVRPLNERIDTFKLLVNKLGLGSVIWRFDPLMLTPDISIDKLLKKIENIGDQLKGYTEKLVFSFADISTYRKVKTNLEANNIAAFDWTEEQMTEFASRLVRLNKIKGWDYKLATCGEKGRYPGIEPNHCIDDELIIRRAYQDTTLMKFLKAEIMPMPVPVLFGEDKPLPNSAIVLGNGYYVTRGDNRDKGQREFCGCIKSKDIGQYNTCIHMCEYCYANTSKQAAAINYKCHKENPRSETITGK
ncbi:MAG: DUF1848 domain-containing protein [Bacteroidales bacterium]|nr:DUF1848 domain-containing protein [Candidatus Sodaliphilus fimicaballi]